MPKRLDGLSVVDARRLALTAQGFGIARTRTTSSTSDALAVIKKLGVVQIDSVNVLVRSQELPLFARLGDHDRVAIPKATARGSLFEYWGHEAAHLPVDLQPLFRWKMDAARTGKAKHWGLTSFYEDNKSYVNRVLKHVEQNGPVTARSLSTRTEKKGTWWDWDEAKTALEYLFLTGQLMSRGRGTDFARIYDTPERVLPSRVLNAPTPSEHDARKRLLVRSAVALGVATAGDLADYYRQRPAIAKPLIAELTEEGVIREVVVDGWKEKAYVHRDATIPKQIRATALLSPFDSLVWCRPRNERLFDFHYRIEIYTPKPKRRFGYYVLPVLCGESLVGRLDMKADRASSTLLVEAAYLERGVSARSVTAPVARELQSMAAWLGLEQVKVGSRGDFARPLRIALHK
ncbi:MAG: winged helix-turn-helix domain-containing protein [Ilumatobacteraceae bacterium]